VTAGKVRSVWQRAGRIGMKVVREGDNSHLYSPDGVYLMSGSVADVDSYLDAHHPRRNPGTTVRPVTPPMWAAMIDDYVRSLAAAGQRQATPDLRLDNLNRIARGVGCPPERVTAEHLVDWFGQQTHWRLETRRSYRSAARKFFQWAHKTGRVAVDLSDALPLVRQITPAPRPTPDNIWRQARPAPTRAPG
jgi:hypothetical protein